MSSRPTSVDGPTSAKPVSYVPVICITLIFFIASWNTRERPLTLFAIPILIWLFIKDLRKPVRRPSSTSILIAAIALLGYDMLSPRAIGQGQPEGHMVDTYARVMNVIWIVFAGALLYKVRRGFEIGWKWLLAVIGLTVVLGSGLILATPQPAIDVWQLHQEAGQALLDGDNPYSDIEVFASSKITEESRVMTGYPYTPHNLLGYGSSAALVGDSRWFSLVCWIGFLALFGVLGAGSKVTPALLVFLASQPAWHVVLEIAYTETVTLLLLVGAIVVWRKRQVMGPLLLGMALATKQYLVVLAPMVLGAKLLTLRSRIIALGSAALTAAIGVLWGVEAYFDSVVAYHLRVPPQEHSVNLYGLSVFFEMPFVVPALVGLVLSVVVGLISARASRTPSQLLIGTAAALGTGFFLATQAFANYWFLVGCILALAFLLADEVETPVVQRGEASVTHA